ncbi:hypothetical protein O9H85_26615 [Paenibacillus filicis]|uniref:Transposase n=1 Tax=Paenibacillus gyeongsangnamensis TaxID=3388067 RepID=A0ABT4QG92_9BACL|nr:hypothetical protein [Paenibacillus filicis]MCZ8515907.1 hypothetical protein [Paenibacillus filicis]
MLRVSCEEIIISLGIDPSKFEEWKKKHLKRDEVTPESPPSGDQEQPILRTPPLDEPLI